MREQPTTQAALPSWARPDWQMATTGEFPPLPDMARMEKAA
jgi:hypothetical protein